MGQLVCDDWFNRAQIGLDGREVSTPLMNVHATTSGELASLGVVVGDVSVVGFVVVEDDEYVVAPLGNMRDTAKDLDDSLQRLADKRECCICDVALQAR